jgi:uncharacterized 2Fe-2S/4Fe-4S cluster protein (DUF4445 family)
MVNVKFLPSGRMVDTAEGNTIMQAALEVGLPLEGVCGGNGMCGKCKVQLQINSRTIEAGALTPAEQKFLTEAEIETGWVLACRHTLSKDAAVFLPGQKDVDERKIGFASLGKTALRDTAIRKIVVVLPKPDIKDQRADWERLAAALPVSYIAFSRTVASSLPRTLRKGGFIVTAVFDASRLIAVESGDTTARSFGLAVDIGTTTLVAYLVDLNSGTVLAGGAATNPQNIFGADVISRITHSASGAGALQELQTKVVGGINGIVETMARKANVNINEIYQAVVVGNTAMGHLFLGLDPSFLAQAPFIPVFQQAVQIEAGELGLAVLETASVTVLPNVAGYVGSDTVGAMLAAEVDRLEGISILVDIGTNGEIVLAGKGRILVCSTAAGPAFEGASIRHGTRAAEGAIERVRIASDVEVTVIGGEKPSGICGSGLVDALSEMLKAGIVERSGRLVHKSAHLATLSPSLRQRLRTTDEQEEFVLVWGRDSASKGDIVITQKDIRELQLAKGAIMAGIRVLMQEMEVCVQELDRILLAGAFGNYISIESAMGIELLPPVSIEKVKTIGNAAGKGAQRALLSVAEKKRAIIIAQSAMHIELSIDKRFQEEFIRSLSFGGGD